MSLAGEADDGHVAAAFDLFTKSTINAMNAGLISSSTERLEVRTRRTVRANGRHHGVKTMCGARPAEETSHRAAARLIPRSEHAKGAGRH
jgi:hypothetical protein